MKFTCDGVEGSIKPSPSKSHTHRAYILASLAEGTSKISSPLVAEDTDSTLSAIESIGALVERGDNFIKITGHGITSPGRSVNMGNSGTTIRLLSGVAATHPDTFTFTGDPSLRSRPMGPLLDALTELGAKCVSKEGYPPVTITGPINGGEVTIDGSQSSQYISALMMAAPLTDGLKINLSGKIVSEPYIRMTMDMMSTFGAEATFNGNTIHVKGKTGYKPADITVQADMSSLAYPLVAAALAGMITIPSACISDEGDGRIMQIIKDFGAEILASDVTTVLATKHPKPLKLDVGDNPDLFPILAVMLSAAEGQSRLYGAPHLRFKETDRIENTVEMLRAIGADVEPTDDGCTINGGKMLKGGKVDPKGDHRVMMAAAVASTICSGPIIISGADCYKISYPAFINDMESIGIHKEVI